MNKLSRFTGARKIALEGVIPKQHQPSMQIRPNVFLLRDNLLTISRSFSSDKSISQEHDKGKTQQRCTYFFDEVDEVMKTRERNAKSQYLAQRNTLHRPRRDIINTEYETDHSQRMLNSRKTALSSTEERSIINNFKSNINEKRMPIDRSEPSRVSNTPNQDIAKNEAFSDPKKNLDSSEETEQPVRSIFDAITLNTNKHRTADSYYDLELFDQYQDIMNSIVTEARFTGADRKKGWDPEALKPVIEWLMSDEKWVDNDDHHKISNILLNENLDTFAKVDKAKTVNKEIYDTENNSNLGISPKKDTKRRKRKLITPDNSSVFNSSILNKGSRSNILYEHLMERRSSFMREQKFSPEQYDLASLALSILGDRCAKRLRGGPIHVAWEKIKEAGMILTDKTLNTYLYVAGNSTSSALPSLPLSLNESIHDGSFHDSVNTDSLMTMLGDVFDSKIAPASDQILKSPMRNDIDKRKKLDVATEIAIVHDLLFKPTEKSLSLRVKFLVSTRDPSKAEALLESYATQDTTTRLRTYVPILKLYCDQGDVSSALKLFKKMKDTPSVILEPQNYIFLIATIAENGYFRSDSKPVEGAKEELGYEFASGPSFFDELISDMALNVSEITSASARRLRNSLAIGFYGNEEGENSTMKPIHPLAGIAPSNSAARPNELVADRVKIDSQTASCPCTGVTLRLILLEKEHKEQLHESLLELSNEQYSKFTGNGTQNTGAEELSAFASWLNSREGEPFTAIVDGANVAYYMQNFERGTFNYHQIQFVVDSLIKINENPLVILPWRYGNEKFHISMGNMSRKQHLSSKEIEIFQNLNESGRLYRVPPRCLDDYYWMLASVSDQTRSRNGATLDVLTNNKDGRWPGTRPMLISNDQMRDHKLEMLEPRLFRRWYSCHIVNYNFTAFVNDECVDDEIGFSPADFFSREIQGNISKDGMVWHFPVSDWDLHERFTIRIPSKRILPA